MRAWIPTNYNNNGGILGGLLKKRNAAEAGIFVVLFIILMKSLSKFLGMALTVIISVIIGLPITIFLLVGFKGESLTVTIKDYFYWKKSRRTVTLRMPEIKLKKSESNKKERRRK